MATKVYVLLDLVEGNRKIVVAKLKRMPGISIVDMLEGPPDLVTVIEAPARQQAAEYLMHVLDAVEGMVEDIRALPVCEPPENDEYGYQVTTQEASQGLKEEVPSYV